MLHSFLEKGATNLQKGMFFLKKGEIFFNSLGGRGVKKGDFPLFRGRCNIPSIFVGVVKLFLMARLKKAWRMA
jgi:hypothetical protein